jgi:hypothetical protein
MARCKEIFSDYIHYFPLLYFSLLSWILLLPYNSWTLLSYCPCVWQYVVIHFCNSTYMWPFCMEANMCSLWFVCVCIAVGDLIIKKKRIEIPLTTWTFVQTWVSNSNTLAVTSGTRAGYTAVFCGCRVARSLVFCVVLCRSLFVFLSLFPGYKLPLWNQTF